MKKYYLISITCFLLIAFKAQASASSTIELSPSKLECAPGEECRLDLSVNPNGNIIDTIRVEMNFPPDLVELQTAYRAKNFSIVSGGNLLNNASGTFSYGLGIPGGTATSGKFMTLLFKGKAKGEGSIYLNSDSMVLNDGMDVYDGLGRSVYLVVSEKSKNKTKFFPDGSLIRGPDHRIYLIINGMKKYLRTLSELKNNAGKPIINIDTETLDSIQDFNGSIKINFSISYGDGNLLRSVTTKRIYLIGGGHKKYISSISELKKFSSVPIYNVTDEELDIYPTSEIVIMGRKKYDDSVMIRDSISNRIYNIKNGVKILVSNTSELKKINKKIINVDSSVIDDYPLAK